MSKQQLKKIAKELEGASKMHAGQAKKVNKIMKKSGFKLREVNSPMKCWKSHKKVGVKKSPSGRTKNGKVVMVSDCVKK